MGYGLDVLLPVENPEDTLESMHRTLINDTLYEDLEIHVDYFSIWDLTDPTCSFFGKDDPERLREIVGKWNDDILKELKESVRCLTDCSSPEEAVSYLISNPFAMIKLKDALNGYTDCFCFGSDRIFYDKDAGYYQIMLPEESRKSIMEHPEDWALIHVIYH